MLESYRAPFERGVEEPIQLSSDKPGFVVFSVEGVGPKTRAVLNVGADKNAVSYGGASAGEIIVGADLIGSISAFVPAGWWCQLRLFGNAQYESRRRFVGETAQWAPKVQEAHIIV